MNRAAGASLLLAAALATSAARAQTSASAEPPVAYMVKPGDTLIGIAARYMNRPSDYRAVQKANGVARPTRLRIVFYG